MINKILQNLSNYLTNKQSRSIGILFMINALIFSNWAIRIPDLKEFLAINDAQLGLALLAAPLGVVAITPVTTFCINRYGAGRVSIISAFLMAFSLILLGLPQNYLQFWLAIFIYGIFNGLMDVSINAVASAIEKSQDKILMSTTHGFWSLGAMIFSLTASFIVGQHISYQSHFIGTSICAAILLLLIYKNLYHIVDSNESNFQWIWPGKHLMILIIVAFIVFLGEGVIMDWNSVFYKEILQTPAAYVGYGFAAFSATMAITRFSGDLIIEKYPLQKILLITSAICALGLFLYASAYSLLVCTIAMLICGAGFSLMIPILFREAGRSEIVAPSLGLALVSTLGYMGFLTGPAVIGFVAEEWGLQVGFLVTGGMMGLVMVISLLQKS